MLIADLGARSSDERAETDVPMSGHFRVGEADRLFVGNERLRSYLGRNGDDWVIRLEAQLRRVDLAALTRAYSTQGRHAIHPRILLGLIVFGLLQQQTSLRALERLARYDVRAWWLTGGEQPDHSTIGKFILQHAEALTGEVFDALVRQLLTELKLKPQEAAIDGTVIESAASRFNMLKREAAQQQAAETAEAARAAPDDPRAAAAAETARVAAEKVEQRAQAREAKGKPADFTRVAATDPEAVNQPRKDGVVRPAYKPSVLASAERLILGTHVDPSGEIGAVAPLIEQQHRVSPVPLERLYADAGYYANTVIALAVRLDIDLLCPSGASSGERGNMRGGRFSKRLFVLQDDGTMRCPAGAPMKRGGRESDRDGRALVTYEGTACAGCPLRARCTTANARVLKWYDGDEQKAALDQVMKQPAARAKYRARSGMVEPVFAALRERQGLQRFHRRGLRRVSVEFALHCIAYNLRRAEGIRRARVAAAFVLFVSGAPTARPVLLVLLTICWSG